MPEFAFNVYFIPENFKIIIYVTILAHICGLMVFHFPTFKTTDSDKSVVLQLLQLPKF